MKISEYVSTGHPDKIADYISEYILDWYLAVDPTVRYAVEVQIKDNHVTLGGEITTTYDEGEPNYTVLVKDALAEIGYTQEYCDKWGTENTINPRLLTVQAHIGKQSPDIAQGVNNDGWGDQGIFWGMATRSKDSYDLPRDYFWAMKLCQHLYCMAADGMGDWGLDIKTQIVLDDNDNITKVIVAAPVLEKAAEEEIAYQVSKILPDSGFFLIINGTGAYVKHASVGDCGTTGRKLAVDFYGGNCRIGGGSPWTKDPTKADLTLNLYARVLAKQALDEYPDIQTAYVSIGCCIGRPEIDVTIYDEKHNVLKTDTYVKTARDIINTYGLDKPIYRQLCKYGLWS